MWIPSHPVRRISICFFSEIFCPDLCLGNNMLQKCMNFNAMPNSLGVLCQLILGCQKKATNSSWGTTTPHSLGTNGTSSYEQAQRVYGCVSN